MTAPILDVEDVEVTFRFSTLVDRLLGRPLEIHAVAGVGFELRKGETFALVGESGSGKTTLARAINGLQDVAAGQVRFDGQDITHLSRAQMRPLRQRMSMMFQDPVGSLSPRMSVGNLISEPFRVHRGETRDLQAEVRRLLDLVGLPASMAERYPHQLSGGQARRVGVARAIALEPKLILADEPTAGLDVSVQAEVLNLLNDLREKLDVAMVIITHNLHVVRHIADNVAVMYLGRFVEKGDTATIFSAPMHPYTAALLSANPEPDPVRVQERIALPAEVPSLLARPAGCEFHTRCPWAQERCAQETPGVREARGRQFTCHFPLEETPRPPDRTLAKAEA